MEILNKHVSGTPADSVYIGRGAAFGNLKVIGKDGTREEVIDWYRGWLAKKIIERDLTIEKSFRSLKKDSKLLCFCSPRQCHGEVIQEYWEFFSNYETYEKGLEAFTKLHINDVTPLTIEDYRKWLIKELLTGNCKLTEDFRNQELSLLLIPDRFRQLKDLAEKVIIPLYNFIIENGSFDEGIIKLAKVEGKMPSYDPSIDGVTHINVYSKGKTKLGRALTNFANIGFDHPEYGRFESVEGFWYWLKTGMRHDSLKLLYGFKAKEEGRKFEKIDVCGFEQKIKEAIFYKVEQCLPLRQALKESTLPFSHYYFYGNGSNFKIIANDNAKWFVDYLELVRKYVKGEAQYPF